MIPPDRPAAPSAAAAPVRTGATTPGTSGTPVLSVPLVPPVTTDAGTTVPSSPARPAPVAALPLAALLLAAGACGDRPGPVRRTSDVAAPPAASATTCVVPDRTGRGARGADAPRTHVVAPGETLRTIAARELGDERLWTEIARANPAVARGSDLLAPGTRLVLPGPGGVR